MWLFFIIIEMAPGVGKTHKCLSWCEKKMILLKFADKEKERKKCMKSDQPAHRCCCSVHIA